MLLGYFFIFAGLAIRGQAAVTPFLVGDGSAPLLGGVLGDGGGLPRDHEHVALVLVAVAVPISSNSFTTLLEPDSVDKFECSGMHPLNQSKSVEEFVILYSNLSMINI